MFARLFCGSGTCSAVCFCLFCSYNICPLIRLGVCLDADCVVLIMLGWLCCVGCVDWTGCAAGCAVPVMLCRLCFKCWADHAVADGCAVLVMLVELGSFCCVDCAVLC